MTTFLHKEPATGAVSGRHPSIRQTGLRADDSYNKEAVGGGGGSRR